MFVKSVKSVKNLINIVKKIKQKSKNEYTRISSQKTI